MAAGPITPAEFVVRNAEMPFRKLDDEVVMLDVAAGCYYGLDAVGSRVWELLEQPRQVREVCLVLVREFDVSLDVCERDVLALVERLLAAGLVRTANADTAGAREAR
jgi:hypothetical protein